MIFVGHRVIITTTYNLIKVQTTVIGPICTESIPETQGTRKVYYTVTVLFFTYLIFTKVLEYVGVSRYEGLTNVN